MSGCSLAKPRFTASTSAMTSRLRFDTSTLALPSGLLDDFVGARRPADAAVQARLRAAELVLVGVAGDERVFVEHQAELARRRPRVEVAQHDDRHARFLREVANEELALVELRGGEHLARELVHRGDAAIDDDHVGAARVADLHRHDCFELAAEHGERVGRRRGGGEPAVVERRPGLALAHRDLDLEAVFLREERIGVRLEAAVRDDQAAVAGVFADVDLQHAVLRRVRAPRLPAAACRRRARSAPAHRRPARPCRPPLRCCRASAARRLILRALAEPQVHAEADDADQQQQRDEVAGGGAARCDARATMLVMTSISFIAETLSFRDFLPARAAGSSSAAGRRAAARRSGRRAPRTTRADPSASDSLR